MSSATAFQIAGLSRKGDTLNIDVTLIVDGWHGDSSRMYLVGEVPRRAQRLVEVTYEAMMRGIAVVRPGATTGDIGAAIQEYAEAERCSVVRDFCGHGLGRLFHDEPNILHYGRRGEGIVLKPGMFFTIEPMINLGRPHVKVLADGWTAVTRDRSMSAQFEHTVGVTETGVEIFTLVAARPPPTSLRALMAGVKNPPGEPEGLAEGPHYIGHRDRLRTRFLEAGDEGMSDYELLELLLFRSMPRRDTKPVAKALISRFGTFAEVLGARIERLKEVDGIGDTVAADLKIVEAAARRMAKGAIKKRPVLDHWRNVIDYCRDSNGLRRSRGVPDPVSRPAQLPHRR